MNNPNFSSKNAHTKQKSLQTVMVQSDCPTDGAASTIMLVCLVESRQRSTIVQPTEQRAQSHARISCTVQFSTNLAMWDASRQQIYKPRRLYLPTNGHQIQ